MNLLYILTLIIILILYKNNIHEKLEIVGYNTSDVPTYNILNSYDIESNDLQVLLSKISKEKKINLDTNTFTLYSNYIDFPFNNIIKSFLADYLSDKLNEKIEINTNIYNMYWKDTLNKGREFIFNINMFSRKHFVTYKLKIKISIKNIEKFTKNDNIQDYKTDVLPKTLKDSIDIVSIIIDKYDNEKFKINGIDYLESKYYTIQNRLSLMDPFLTSHKDMIISNTMKKNFEISLLEHQKLASQNKKNIH